MPARLRTIGDSMMRGIVLLVLLIFGFISCSDGPTSPSDTGITGVTWRLRSIQRPGAPTIEIRDPERFTMRFGEDLRAAVRADCNVCTGRYQLIGSDLQVSSLACTRAFCGVESPDTQFLRALEPSVSVSRTGATLVLTGAGTVLLFEQ